MFSNTVEYLSGIQANCFCAIELENSFVLDPKLTKKLMQRHSKRSQHEKITFKVRDRTAASNFLESLYIEIEK